MKLKHVIYYHENGTKKSEGDMQEDGISAFGPWVFWDSNGQVCQVRSYDEKGMASGRWTTFWDGNTKQSEGLYQNGMKTGLWQHWHQNGRLKTGESFVDGKEDGLSQAWTDTGVIISRGTYIKGMRHGTWTFNGDSPDGGYSTEWYMGGLTNRAGKPPDQPEGQKSWYYPVVPGQLDGFQTPFDMEGPCSGLYFGMVVWNGPGRFTYIFKPVTAFTFHDSAGLTLVINDRYSYLMIFEKIFTIVPGITERQGPDPEQEEKGNYFVITDPIVCIKGKTKPQYSEHSRLSDAVHHATDTALQLNVRVVTGRFIRHYPLDI